MTALGILQLTLLYAASYISDLLQKKDYFLIDVWPDWSCASHAHHVEPMKVQAVQKPSHKYSQWLFKGCG